MRERAEGCADIGRVAKGGRLAVLVRREREVVLGVLQAVQHRRVLGKQQRNKKQ